VQISGILLCKIEIVDGAAQTVGVVTINGDDREFHCFLLRIKDEPTVSEANLANRASFISFSAILCR